jgi:hypothetical protein
MDAPIVEITSDEDFPPMLLTKEIVQTVIDWRSLGFGAEVVDGIISFAIEPNGTPFHIYLGYRVPGLETKAPVYWIRGDVPAEKALGIHRQMDNIFYTAPKKDDERKPLSPPLKLEQLAPLPETA